MKNLKLNTLIVAALAFVLSSCHKDKNVTPPTVQVTAGLYVLNQGIFNDNNSTLTYYDYASKQTTADIFSSANGRGLGDTGNDIEIYGGKMYIVVNVTSTIEVVNPSTAKSIKTIQMFNGTVAREPRDIVFYKGDAYITSYDGTVAVMDTASLTISKYITVGNDPEELAVANNKIYVANSGGLAPTFDKTVSVIDPTTNTVTKTLTVVVNPVFVSTDNNGHVYVLSIGDYNTIGSSLAVIDDNADVVTSQTNFDASFFTVTGSTGYFVTNEGKVGTYNTSNQTIASSNFISDGTAIQTPFTIKVDPSTSEVFVTDAKDYASNGEVFAFNSSGKLEYSFTTGITPGSIALFKK